MLCLLNFFAIVVALEYVAACIDADNMCCDNTLDVKSLLANKTALNRSLVNKVTVQYTCVELTHMYVYVYMYVIVCQFIG